MDDETLKKTILTKVEAVWRLGRGTALDLPLDPELSPEDATDQILLLIKQDRDAAYQRGRIDEAKICNQAKRHQLTTNSEVNHE